MASELRVFISHSAGDAGLVKKLVPLLEAGLKKIDGRTKILVDVEGLKAGRPWRRDIHSWMVRCNAALVLLTPKVLAKSDWVVKEADFFSVFADVNPQFRLWYARADGVTDAQLDAAGFAPANIKTQQLLQTPFAKNRLDDLVTELCASLPTMPSVTEDEAVLDRLEDLLAQEPVKKACRRMAERLSVPIPGTWGADQTDVIAALTARAALNQRSERKMAIGALLFALPWLVPEHKRPFVNLLAPLWVSRAAANRLRDCTPDPARPDTCGATVIIAGDQLPKFTGEMYVRRAFGVSDESFIIQRIGGVLGGDLFAGIKESLCTWARNGGWAETYDDDVEVVKKLRDYPLPIFVPLGFQPDPVTCDALREAFPRFLFLAPRFSKPTPGTGANGESDPGRATEIIPGIEDWDSYFQMETTEFNSWFPLSKTP